LGKEENKGLQFFRKARERKILRSDEMRIEARVLQDASLRLEPMAARHRDDLRAACDADPDIWERLYSLSRAGEHFDGAWARLEADVAAGRNLAFAVVVAGACVGMTCFQAPDPANRSVEIGWTYYRPEHRGGRVNPAAKRLLLAAAFDAGAIRVRLNVDALNARSCAAVLKLGAVQEGVLRQDRVIWTGRVRDTVVFSILKDEWPAVRAGLDRRLAAFG
jgi:RimJ/RimL family protein N-acetyltransferase